MEKAFNKYANYALYGNDSDKRIADAYDENEGYAIDQLYYERYFDWNEEVDESGIEVEDVEGDVDATVEEENEDNEEVEGGEINQIDLNDVIVLFDDFKEIVEAGDDSRLKSMVDEYGEKLDLLEAFLNEPDVSNEDVARIVKMRGSDGSKKWVDDQFGSVDVDANGTIEEYLNLKKRYYEVMVNFYGKANEAGCLGEGEEITCSDYNDVDNLTQMVDILSDANEIRNGEMADLALGCFKIADYLYGDANLTSGGDEE